MTAYFDAQYTANPALGPRPQMLETLTKEAPLERCGMHARVTLNIPLILVFINLFQYSSVMVSVASVVGLIPAQLKMWLIWPWIFITSSMCEFTADVDPTSKPDVLWLPGVHNERVSARLLALMSESARVAPKEESFMAVPLPIPLPAPVIRMTLSWNDGGIVEISIDERSRLKWVLCKETLTTLAVVEFRFLRA